MDPRALLVVFEQDFPGHPPHDLLLAGRAKLKYYEAGMDLGLSTDLAESFRLFQGRVLENYDRLAEEFDLRVIDANHDIAGQQKVVRRMTGEILLEYDEQRARISP